MTDSIGTSPLGVSDSHPIVQKLEAEISDVDKKIAEMETVLNYMVKPCSGRSMFGGQCGQMLSRYPNYFKAHPKAGKSRKPDAIIPKRDYSPRIVEAHLNDLLATKRNLNDLRWKIQLSALIDPSFQSEPWG